MHIHRARQTAQVRVQREATRFVGARAAAGTTLFIERRLRNAVNVAVKVEHETFHPGELREAPVRQHRQTSEAPVRRNDEIPLDELAARSTQVEIIAADEDLLVAELAVAEAVYAQHLRSQCQDQQRDHRHRDRSGTERKHGRTCLG